MHVYKKSFYILLLILLNKVTNEDLCEKLTPIKTSSGCKSIFCSDEEYENGECIISNSIIKKQWLNNKITYGGGNVQTSDIIYLQNNVILFASNGGFYDNEADKYINNTMYLYGLNNLGENLYSENEDIFKTIPLNDKYFEQYNSVGIIINDVQYLMICSKDLCGIIDIDSGMINYKENYSQFFGVSSQLDTIVFSLINVNNKDKIILNGIARG